MNPRKKLVIATLFICLYPALPLLFGAISFFAVPAQNNTLNETALNQTSAFVGTLYNILGYLTILSYILLIAGIGLIVSVIRSMPKTKVEIPKTTVDVPKPQTVVKPQREKREHRGLWEALNSEIGEKRPIPVPQAPKQAPPVPVQVPKKEEPKTTTCPGCLREYKHPGMNKKLRCTNCGYLWST